MSSKKVIVAGATGKFGQKIVKALLEQGADVTALVRATSIRDTLEALGVRNFVIGDMMDKASLKQALSSTSSYDAIIASAAGYTRHTKGDNAETDTIGYRNLVDAVRDAGIPRFVLLSILECDKAPNVPHFYNKYLIEQYLAQKKQPYIALRAGAFMDQTMGSLVDKLNEGIVPVFFQGVDYGTIYTVDLARYLALAAVSVPDSALNSIVDVGLSTPVNGDTLAAAFAKVLNKPMKVKPAIPAFVTKVVFPVIALFNPFLKDMNQMIKWVNTGVYISHNTHKQKELFGDLPSIEEAVVRYCRDNNLIN